MTFFIISRINNIATVDKYNKMMLKKKKKRKNIRVPFIAPGNV